MATTPAYASAPVVWPGLIPATADTSLTAPSNVTTLGTDAGIGTKIEEITLQGVGTTVSGIVNLFLHDGSTHYLFDQVIIAATTSSTTLSAFRTTRPYQNLLIPSGWSLLATGTVAGNQSMVEVIATGGSL